MKILLKNFAALTAALAVASSAHAVATLTLQSGALPAISVTDGSGSDLNPAAGAVTFIGAVGNWNLNVSTGLSYPVLGSAIAPHMDLNSVNTSNGAGTLVLTFTDTFGPTGSLGLIANIGGTASSAGVSSVNYEILVNGVLVPGFSVGSFSGGAFSGSDLGLIAGGQSYTITQRVTITHSETGASSFDAELISTPDSGSTLVFLGMGLLGLGFARRQFARR